MNELRKENLVRVIALGNQAARDDGVALVVGQAIMDRREDVEILLAGRPGVGLLDLFDAGRPTLVLDAVRAGLHPGESVCVSLEQVCERALSDRIVSAHGVGLGEAARLGVALGRRLPPGLFFGVQVERTDPGFGLSRALANRLHLLIEDSIRALVALEKPSVCQEIGLRPDDSKTSV